MNGGSNQAGWGSTAASGAGQAAITGIGMYAGYRIGSKSDKLAFERQKELMSTAHQMEVEDLRKAGLNPILSAGGSGAHPGSVANSAASAAVSGADTGAKLGKEIAGKTLEEIQSRIDLNSASAKEINARRAFEYGVDKDDPFEWADSEKTADGMRVTPWEGQKFKMSAEQVQELKHRVEVLNQEARSKGYSNIKEAVEAGLYEGEKGKWLLGAEKLLNALKTGTDVNKKMKGK